jgi:hypothetical protein
LTCVHHAHLPLYGGGVADTLACGTMIAAAVVTGVGRVVTEEHHAFDLVMRTTFVPQVGQRDLGLGLHGAF